MSNEELKQNLTSTNQWLRLIYMVLFAVLLEIAGFVMLAVVIAQFLFAIFTGSANDNLRRLGDQIASYIYQTLQFLIYNSEEKPFPFSEWPESEEEDLSTYESAEEIDGEVISAEDTVEEAEDEADAEAEAPKAEDKPAKTKASAKTKEDDAGESATKKDSAKKDSAKKDSANKGSAKKDSAEEETVIEMGTDSGADPKAEDDSKSSDDKK